MIRRHRWVKLRLHTYICRRCGCGKVNALRDGRWFATFHLPTGETVHTGVAADLQNIPKSATVPACKPGPYTPAFLLKYKAEVLAAGRKATSKRGGRA